MTTYRDFLYEYQSPQGDGFMEDLSLYRRHVIDRIHRFWQTFADDVKAELVRRP